MTNEELSKRSLHLVGLHKSDHGRSCRIHPNGCGYSLKPGNKVLLQVIEYEEDVPVAVLSMSGRKKRKVEDMVELNKNISIGELAKYTKAMLNGIADQFQLSKKGKKDELVQRIYDFVQSPAFAATVAATDSGDEENDNDPFAESTANESTLHEREESSSPGAEELDGELEGCPVRFEEYPELQEGRLPAEPKLTTKKTSTGCIASLVCHNVATCRVGFVSKVFFNLYGERLHHRVAVVESIMHESVLKCDRERSYRSNGMATIKIICDA